MRNKLNRRKSEAGQALAFVTIILLLAALIIPSLLALTYTSYRSAQIREDRMLELYAADAGIEDALYEIKNQMVDIDYGETCAWSPSDINESNLDITVQKVWLPQDLGYPAPTDDSDLSDEVPMVGMLAGADTFRVEIAYAESIGVVGMDRLGIWLPPGFTYVGVLETLGIDLTGVIFTQTLHRSGTALEWDFSASPIDLSQPIEEGGGGGGFTPGSQFPIVRSLTFQFTPEKEPEGTFVWLSTTEGDVSWDASCDIYKAISIATDPLSGAKTKVEAYVAQGELNRTWTTVYGDYRAVGNTLMRDTNGDPVNIRDVLDPESSAEISNIPDDASVEAAYLYWSAWWQQEAADTDVTFRVERDDGVNIVDTTVTLDFAQGDKQAILQNPSDYAYACRADVTSLLQTEVSAAVTINPIPGEMESVTITWVPGWFSTYGTVEIAADANNPGSMSWEGVPIAPGSMVSRTYNSGNPSDVLTSGTALGDYDATITYVDGNGWFSYVDVDGTHLNEGESTPWQLYTSGSVSEEVIITRNPDQIGVEATVEIGAAGGNPGNLEVNGYTIIPGDAVTLDLNDSHPSYAMRLSDVEAGDCDATITCTAGSVIVVDGADSFFLSAEGFNGNGTYTVGDVEAKPGELYWTWWGEFAYAGWSLIIIYASPSELAHHISVYDYFLYAEPANSPHTFSIEGFQVPDLAGGEGGRLTCFAGEGDEHYATDSLKFNDNPLPYPGDPYDGGGINPQDNVWNSISNAHNPEGEPIDGIDIDTLDVTPFLEIDDTSAEVEMASTFEGWNVVYLILSFRTAHAPPPGYSFTVGTLTYTYGIGEE